MQRGTITAVLEIVLLLLTLSENNSSSFENLYALLILIYLFIISNLEIIFHFTLNYRSDGEECASPMLPFLKRFQNALRSTFINLNDFDIWCDKDSDDATAVRNVFVFLICSIFSFVRKYALGKIIFFRCHQQSVF